MKIKRKDIFGHWRTCYVINDKIILPAKYFGNKARSDFDKWAIFDGVAIECYIKTLKQAINKAEGVMR